jgi:hypothetical protein
MNNTITKNVPAQLFELLNTKGFETETFDINGKSIDNPSDAAIFSFKFKTENKNYGSVVSLISDITGLILFYGRNITSEMSEEDKKIWYNFLHHLRFFSKRNLLNFSLKDISRISQTIKSMSLMNTDLNESYYGNKRISYCDFPQQTKIMIKHTKPLGDSDRRYANIENVFVETENGERFLMPFKKISSCKAMARHISDGGRPWDEFGKHIISIHDEIELLRKAIRKGLHEGESAEELNETYKKLKKNMKKISGTRGYAEYMNEYQSQHLSESTDHYLKIFEDWVDNVIVSKIPTGDQIKKLEELLKDPVSVGPDGLSAMELFRDLIDSEELMDRFYELSKVDPDADSRPAVVDWLSAHSEVPSISQLLEKIKLNNNKK